MSKELEVYDVGSGAMQIQDLQNQVNLIQHVMKEVMKEDEHFGTIPGCGKKQTLFKSGAEKLIMTFRLVPDIDVETVEMANGHREYRTKVTICAPTGAKLGTGVGSCSTMEGKYRYRTGEKKVTDKRVPKEYWSLRNTDIPKAQKLIGAGNGTKKGDDGEWYITEGGGSRVEHDNPADYYNTCLKMSKKRGLVDAVLTVTAASDIFTQDIEDMPEVIPAVAKAQETKTEAPQETVESPSEGSQEPTGDNPAPTSKGSATEKQVNAVSKMLYANGHKEDFEKCSEASSLLGFSDVIAKLEFLDKEHASTLIPLLGEMLDKKKAEAPDEASSIEPF